MKIDINPELFDKPFHHLFKDETRVTFLMGGGSSGKSYTMWAYSVLWMLQGQSILACRKVGATLPDSVIAEINNAISYMEVGHLIEYKKGERLFQSKISGGTIKCVGLDSTEKIKSIRPRSNTAFSIVIYDEVTEAGPDEINQLLIRQRGDSEFPKRFIGIFNPISKNHHIYKDYFEPNNWTDKSDHVKWEKEILLEDGSTDTLTYQAIKVTYKDNTHLSPQDKAILENFKYTSPYYYSVYCLGNFGAMGDRIFPLVEYDKIDFDTFRGSDWKMRLGIDWGGLSDKNTFTISFFNTKLRTIYLVDGIEHLGMSFEPFAEQIKALMASYNISPGHLILTDTSDTRADSVLKQFGLNLKHAKKGPGSELAQLKWLHGFKIIARDTPMFINAFNDYVWKKDKNGDTMNEAVHTPDILAAFRYSFTGDMKHSSMRGGNYR